MSNTKLTFSRHARVRQEQRNITDSSINGAIEFGEKTDCKEGAIYTDQNINVVFSNDNCTIITVKQNTRNTRFKLTERTKEKETSLLFEVNKKNNNHAMCELAELYLEGQLGEKDIRKAYNLFKRAAKMGNSHAMCKISQMYEIGDLGTPNQELADMWMKKSADRNNVFALAVTGQKLLLKYLKKYPVESNIFRPSAPKKEILDYLNRASDKGSTRGTWQLGNIYEEGLLGEKNLSKAIEFYVKAAKTGSPASIDSLYDLTLESKFSATELEEILDNVSPRLTNTSIGMAFQIGHKQLIGKIGYNKIRGLKMVEQAALQQYDQAMHVLSKCYREGMPCTTNLKLAHFWFIKLHELYNISAKEGNVISLWKLGKLYLNGNVDNIDLEKAESCFKEAIEKSSRPDWIYELGMLYLRGRLGDKPTNVGNRLITQAIRIWQFQVEQGNTKAYFHIGDAYLSINSHKKAVYWLSKSSDDDIDSQLSLAQIYLDDLSPEKNISLGLKILESIVLKHGIHPKEAFKAVEFTINNQTISWLQDIANNITKPIPKKNSIQHAFQKFVITILANVYETGKLGKINYDLASKYFHQLFVDFESIAAGNKLALMQHLPMEYYDTVKNWALKIPTLFIETDTIDFRDCVLLLGKMYQKGNILPYNVKEATKWLYLASYFIWNSNYKTKDIEHDLENLPNLDFNQKEQIVSELLQTTQNIKINSPIHFKIMSRILGDIFYDNKIINQNIDKAIYWYTESSLKNNAKASLALAKIYQYDKKDIDTSIRWYMLSTQQGNKDALKALTAIVNDQHLDNLSLFLNKYQHQSVIKESDVMNIKPLNNLEFYPKTAQEKFELGKSFLHSENKQDINILNAAFWFRKAMKRDSIDAAVELFSMYKSGILGNNLMPVADILRLEILSICYSKLKENIISGQQDTSSVLLLLNNVSPVLKIDNINSSIELSQSLETVLSQSQDVDNETLTDIVSKLELLQLELCSNMIDSTTSNDLDTAKSQ